jgi:insulysin
MFRQQSCILNSFSRLKNVKLLNIANFLKYPQENEYNEYLAAHNGSSNAYTSFTSTNYYFEVAASSSPSNSKASSTVDLTNPHSESIFYGALDRFAQFFADPLFLEDTLDREIRSVDSENKKNLQSDVWRLHQLQQSLSNPMHPFCHFSTGNWDTLHEIPLKRGQNLRDEFMKFYQTHYSANRMKLVILGRESLDELQKWATMLFSPIKNQNLPRLRWDSITLWTEKELLTQTFAKPVIDSRYIELYFPYQDEEDLFESKPSTYISHLIGHEGPGSILAYLKEKGWANDLSAGSESVCPGTAYFEVQVRLTEEGLVRYKDVLEVVFQYVAMLNETQPLEWIFEEGKRMSEVDFKFRQNSRASKTVSSLSSVMQHPGYPRHRLLSARHVVTTYNPKAITSGLDSLRPDNCRIALVSQHYPGTWDSKEHWYGTDYKYEKVDPELQIALKSAYTASANERPAELHLPHRNEFIPTRLEVERKEVAEPAKVPKLIRNDNHVRTWFKKDDQFWVPKAYLNVSLRTPLAYITPRCSIMAQLYCALVQDALNEYSYDAELAGLAYSLSSDALGLEVNVFGYNDKMAVLLEKVLRLMRNLEVKETRFGIIKERFVRSLKNWGFKQPYQQISHYRSWLNTDRSWTNEQYFIEIPSIVSEDIKVFIPQLLQQLHIEVLAHGNLHKEDALQLTDLCERILKPHGLPPDQWPIRRSLILPEGSDFVYERPLADTANVNHCIEYVVWAGSNWFRPLRAKVLLAAQLADEPCYDQLRTKEQLGYVVFSSAIASLHRIGFRVLVQSEKSPEYLEGRIDSFLEQFGKMIEEMDEVKFEKHKNGLINKVKEKPKNLKEEMERLWTFIMTEYFDFDQGNVYFH